LTRPSLASVAAFCAGALGILACVAGAGLLLAIGVAGPVGQQILTAYVLACAGVANIAASSGIWRGRGRAIWLSAVATVALIGYSAAVLHDEGEFFWLHVAYLILLAVFYRQRSSRPAAAA
jgi:hypothetical protein